MIKRFFIKASSTLKLSSFVRCTFVYISALTQLCLESALYKKLLKEQASSTLKLSSFVRCTFVFIFTLSILISCNSQNRGPSSVEVSSGIRISTYQFEGQRKLILIGVDPELSNYKFDVTEIGFKPTHPEQNIIDPKFLISVNERGLQRVYAFEYGNTAGRKIHQSMEDTDFFYMRTRSRDQRAKLPRMFLDLPDNKVYKRPWTYLRHLAEIVAYTPWAPIGVAASHLFDIFGAKKEYQAGYLLKWVEMALNGHLPELYNAIGEEELLKLGGSIKIRYKSENKPTDTTFINNKNKAEYYRTFMLWQKEIRSENMSKLIERCNEEGLLAVPLHDDLVYMFYDLNYKIDPERYAKLITGKIDFEKIEELYGDQVDVENSLIPIGIFTLNNKEIPISAVDFRAPNRNIKGEDWARLVRFALEVGFSFINQAAISGTLNVVKGLTTLSIRKSGSTIFNDRIYSQAHLTALLETGAIEFDYPGILKQSMLDKLAELGLDEEDEQVYREKLENSTSAEEMDRTVRELILLFEDSQKEHRKWARLHGSYMTSNKYVAWSRLKNFMKDQEELQDYNDWLVRRNRNVWYSKRYPSSVQGPPLRPTIIFWLQGMSERKMHRHLRNNDLPNIKKLFYDKGMGIDTFATQPIENPSLASIWTGEEQDRHGIKSDAPIDRSDGKVDENFTDTRKETYFPKYFKKSRSFMKLEESQLKFIPHEFGEYYTNYMPLYNGGYGPIMLYLTEAFKDIPEALSGLYSHEMVMDKATIKQTMNKLKKEPGKFNLINYYFKCPGYFIEKSNHALSYCLKTLDKGVGELIEFLKYDPRYKDAQLYLLSEAAMHGGLEEFDSKDVFLNNTGLHLVKYFAGDYYNRDYFYSVSTNEAPEPDYDVTFLQEFYIQPFRTKYRGKKRDRPKEVSVLIDFFGDAQAKISLKDPSGDWSKRPGLCTLMEYPKGRGDGSNNIVRDLLEYKLRNIAVVDQSLRKYVMNETKMHPVQFLAYAEKEQRVIKHIQNKTGRSFDGYPVLLQSIDGAALILQKYIDGKKHFNYIPISFKGCIDQMWDFDLMGNEDILGLSDIFKTHKWVWENDLIQLLKNHKYPVALQQLSSTFNIHSAHPMQEKLEMEIADLVLFANYGFNFNSSNKSQADTGHFDRRNSKILMRYSELSRPLMLRHDDGLKNMAIYNKDILGVIYFNGMDEFDENRWMPQWDWMLPFLK